MEKKQILVRLLTEIRAGYEEIIFPVRTNREEMKEETNAWRKKMKAHRVATKASLEKMEENPEEIKFVAAHQEVPNEEAGVEIIGPLKEWHGDRYLAVGRRQQPRKGTQG
jgi:hypothetical protein